MGLFQWTHHCQCPDGKSIWETQGPPPKLTGKLETPSFYWVLKLLQANYCPLWLSSWFCSRLPAVPSTRETLKMHIPAPTLRGGLPQTWHWWGFSPEWTTRCFQGLDCLAKAWPHPWASQRKGFSPVWMWWWFFRFAAVVNCLPHARHIGISPRVCPHVHRQPLQRVGASSTASAGQIKECLFPGATWSDCVVQPSLELLFHSGKGPTVCGLPLTRAKADAFSIAAGFYIVCQLHMSSSN